VTSAGPSLYPLLHYRDAFAAMDFLEHAFGFQRLSVVPRADGGVQHAELALDQSILMIGGDDDDPRLPDRPGRGWIYVAVDDVHGHCETARRHGAQIITEPFDSEHGFRGYTALDPEGNQWHFGSHRPVVQPPHRKESL
jgi:uncharacterized glyoxalase superfamily protein PhnB